MEQQSEYRGFILAEIDDGRGLPYVEVYYEGQFVDAAPNLPGAREWVDRRWDLATEGLKVAPAAGTNLFTVRDGAMWRDQSLLARPHAVRMHRLVAEAVAQTIVLERLDRMAGIVPVEEIRP